jgi:HEAT repeat protein
MITPGECRVLLSELIVGGKVNEALQRRLETTTGRIDGVLCEVLLDRDLPPLYREVAATILGERRNQKAVQHLITALTDPAEAVRFDALVAIEKAASLPIGTLVEVLRLDRRKPRVLRRRVEEWWKLIHSR